MKRRSLPQAPALGPPVAAVQICSAGVADTPISLASTGTVTAVFMLVEATSACNIDVPVAAPAYITGCTSRPPLAEVTVTLTGGTVTFGITVHITAKMQRPAISEDCGVLPFALLPRLLSRAGQKAEKDMASHLPLSAPLR